MQKFRYAGGVPDEGGQPLMLAGNFHCDGRLSKLCSGVVSFFYFVRSARAHPWHDNCSSVLYENNDAPYVQDDLTGAALIVPIAIAPTGLRPTITGLEPPRQTRQ
jgi:hypothetical protein